MDGSRKSTRIAAKPALKPAPKPAPRPAPEPAPEPEPALEPLNNELHGDLLTLNKELHKRALKPDKRRMVITKGIDDVWATDLIDVSNKAADNDGFKYVMVVIDCFSRYAWTEPMKGKTAKDSWAAFDSILKRVGHTPLRLWADRGGEYYSALWKQHLHAKHITLYSTYSESKSVFAERFIGTLKTKYLWPAFQLQGKYRWLDKLPGFVKEYNETKHSGIIMTPAEARDKAKQSKLWDRLYTRAFQHVDTNAKFKVGDWVRLSKTKGTFSKGYGVRWTEQPYRVSKVMLGDPIVYNVAERDGTPLEGSFYANELQHTAVPDVGFAEIQGSRKVRGQSCILSRAPRPAPYL